MSYQPKPIDTSGVKLDRSIVALTEKLAEHAHEVWAQQRIKDGWRLGPRRDDPRQEHPSLIPYQELSEAEKQYDRNAALETLKVILALGYSIEAPTGASAPADSPSASPPELATLMASMGSHDLPNLLEIWRNHKPEEWADSPELYITLADRFIQSGEPLLAYDVLSEGLSNTQWTDAERIRMRQLQALSLARSGATRQANNMLRKLREEEHLDEETLGMLARTHKDLALQAADPGERDRQLQLALEIYGESYKLQGGYWTGINAATLSLLLGRKDQAFALAIQVREQCLNEMDNLKNRGGDAYWLLATLGEAALLLNDFSEAEDWYGQAAAAAGKRFGQISSTRQNARLIVEYLHGDWPRIERCLHIPRVAVFAGHMIDQPGRAAPRFPPQPEGAVRHALRERVKKLDVGFGYASPARGSDLLFLEVLLELGGETHVVLPYERQRFLRDSVQTMPEPNFLHRPNSPDNPYGPTWPNWETRYQNALASAAEVVTVSGHRLSEGAVSYDYANQMLLGLAIMRAEQLGTELMPLAVWDGSLGDGPGGTASSVERWRGLGYAVEVIELDRLLAQEFPSATTATKEAAPAVPLESTAAGAEAPPRIVAIMFADAKGFSKLTEEQTPLFVQHFLEMVGEMARGISRPGLSCGHQPPAMMNTWGDGLFFIFENVGDAASFALDLCDRAQSTAWAEKGLPDLGVRIGLHAGPAHPFIDPVTQKLNFIGTHVSQAARIEPITPPNQVYASQHFAALAALDPAKTFNCEYVGQTPLAKDFGTFPMYVVRRRVNRQSNL